MSVGSQVGASQSAAPEQIVARIERLPVSWWHVKTRIIIGVATFFDAFDALAIASVLPAIVPMWKLTPPQIGFLISAGFLGHGWNYPGQGSAKNLQRSLDAGFAHDVCGRYERRMAVARIRSYRIPIPYSKPARAITAIP